MAWSLKAEVEKDASDERRRHVRVFCMFDTSMAGLEACPCFIIAKISSEVLEKRKKSKGPADIAAMPAMIFRKEMHSPMAVFLISATPSRHGTPMTNFLQHCRPDTKQENLDVVL